MIVAVPVSMPVMMMVVVRHLWTLERTEGDEKGQNDQGGAQDGALEPRQTLQPQQRGSRVAAPVRITMPRMVPAAKARVSRIRPCRPWLAADR